MSGLRGLRRPEPPDGPREGERRRQARAYEGAFEAVAAIVIAALVGYWADRHFESSPIGLFTGVVLGFAAMVLRLLRLGRQLGMTDEAGKPGNENEPGDE